MNAPDRTTTPTIGAPFEGGYFAGIICTGDATHALIVSPIAGDLPPAIWLPARKQVKGAPRFNDGYANTNAMALAGSKLAEAVLELDIGGFTDWYLPARDELELLYRHFKPTDEMTWVLRHGDNPSSVPTGYPYAPDHPQTAVENFRQGGADALQDVAYWSSTLDAPAPACAWAQHFANGTQSLWRHLNEFRARAVRRLPI